MAIKPHGEEPQVIQAAGGLVWRETPQGRSLAVIHRPRHDDWTLPKGKLFQGESWQEAALREVQEETSCEVRLAGFTGCTCYMTKGAPKVVLFWNMALTGACRFQPNEEVDQLKWLSVPEALDKLEYEQEKALVEASATGTAWAGRLGEGNPTD